MYFKLFIQLLLISCYLSVATAEQQQILPTNKEVSLTAGAQVIIEPNVALITAVIETSDLKATNAQKLANESAKKIKAALDKEFANKTKQFNRDEKYSGATPADFTLSSNAVIRVRKFIGIQLDDLSVLAQVIDVILANGANAISEVRVYPSEDEALIASAISKATKAAKLKAEAAASAVGAKLGNALSVTISEEPEAMALRLEQQRGRTLEPLSDKNLFVYVTVRYELL